MEPWEGSKPPATSSGGEAAFAHAIDMEPWEGSKPPATSSGGEAAFAHAIDGDGRAMR
jgi:hypothetical protein